VPSYSTPGFFKLSLAIETIADVIEGLFLELDVLGSGCHILVALNGLLIVFHLIVGAGNVILDAGIFGDSIWASTKDFKASS